MKRLWIGIGLLLVLMGAGIFAAGAMQSVHAPVAEMLEQASRAALSEDWGSAERLSNDAERQWQQHWHGTAAMADHEPMEEIDSLFAELTVYLQSREDVHFAASCRNLSRLVKAVGEAHTINWWNLM